MKKVKQTRPNNSGESASIQSKKTPVSLVKAARRFHNALDLVLEELDESFKWSQSDGECIRLLTIRQNIGQLRDAAYLLALTKGVQLESKMSEEVESAGHMTARNIWIKIGLSPLQMAAVRKIRAWSKSKPNEVTVSHIVRVLIINSLAHYGSIRRLFSNDKDYAHTEGFPCIEEYQESIIKNAFSLKPMGRGTWE